MSKTQLFIEKARAVHGDRYDYSKTVYVRSGDKVIITCSDHGDFEQTPDNHGQGRGCAKCAFGLVSQGKIVASAKVFIEKARAEHGNRYDYSKTVYVHSQEKVIITCKEHGDFEQIAYRHTRGKGCSKCSTVAAAEKNTKNTRVWLVGAKKTHGNRYDYSKTVYVHSREKVIITCKEHGDFEQRPFSHLEGKGCPRCPRRYDQPTSIYLMQAGGRVKIGVSTDPESRLSIINRNNPEPAHIVATWTLEDFPTAYAMEQELHQRLREYHAGLTGFDGATEWFNTTPCHAEWVINKAVQYANEVCKL